MKRKIQLRIVLSFHDQFEELRPFKACWTGKQYPSKFGLIEFIQISGDIVGFVDQKEG